MSTTTEVKHTAGPWAVEVDDYGINVYSKKTATCTVYICESVQSAADAALIAAAPDLLNALQGLYDGCTECGSAMCDHKGLKDQYANAVAAIQKAREAQGHTLPRGNRRLGRAT